MKTNVSLLLGVAFVVGLVESGVILHRDAFAYGSSSSSSVSGGDQLDFGDNDRPTDHAKVARDIVHKSNWTSFGTISTTSTLAGFPMVNIISVADSKFGAKSTGVIYFLLTNLDYTGQDLSKNNRLTMMFTQDQDLDCSRQRVDPMEPTCARVIISGRAIKMTNNTEEYEFGLAAFMDRHPAASNWIAEHNFYLCKVEMSSIIVLDWYGGPHHVTNDEYFNAKYDNDGQEWPAAGAAAGGLVLQDSNSVDVAAHPSKRLIRIHVEPTTNDVVIEV